jgi:hypothetical protein
MIEEGSASPTRRAFVFGLIALPLLAACAAVFDLPAQRRGEEDDPDYGAPDTGMDGNMGGQGNL